MSDGKTKATDPLLLPGDEGELEFKIARIGDFVFFDFGKSIEWIGFSRDELIDLVEKLNKQINEIA